jgi:hypothetical protein
MNQGELFTAYLRLTALSSNFSGHAQLHDRSMRSIWRTSVRSGPVA